jgi:hypothetical protein
MELPEADHLLFSAGRPSSGTYSTVYNDHRIPLYMRKIIPIPEDVFRFGQSASYTLCEALVLIVCFLYSYPPKLEHGHPPGN